MEPTQPIELTPPQNPPTTTTTSIAMPSSPSGDDNQAEDKSKLVEEEDATTQNPSNPTTDSDPLQHPQSEPLETQDPDPPNPSNFTEPASPDRSLQQQEPAVVVDEQDPEDQEGMALSPSHQPLISDAHVEERESNPPLSSSRRAHPSRRKRGFAKNNPRKLAAIEKKVQALTQNLKAMPFVPSKALDFSRYEEQLRRLGLWDFAHLEFDRKLRADLVAKLIVTYNEKNRCSYIDNVRIMVNQADLARALNLSSKKPVDCGEEAWPVDFVSFVDDFVSNWMLLHEDTWILPTEVVNWTRVIKEGHPEKVDWARLIWFMVKKELSRGTQLVNCYYASHLQHLIKTQKEELLKEKPKEVEEIMVLKEEDEEEESDVKVADESSHGGEPEMNVENVQLGLGQEGNVGIDNVQSNRTVENVDNVDVVGNVGDAENVSSLSHGADTADHGGHMENLETADHVENLNTAVDHVVNPETAGDHVENPDTAGDHVENLETAGDHVENLGTAGDHVENLGTAGDHVENLKTAGDRVEDLDTAGDHVENLKTAGDRVENLDTAGDHVDHVENMEAAGYLVEDMKIDSDHAENMEAAGDFVEDMKIDSDHVENMNIAGDLVEDRKTNDDVGDAHHAQIQGARENDMMDFEECKTEEQGQWDLSQKDGEQEHFLRQCPMSRVKVDEEQRRQNIQGEEVEDDEAEDDEHDEQVEGFDTLQKCTSFNGLSSGLLLQAMEPSQIPYTSDFGDQLALDARSIFGNAPKRELDHDSDISHHSLNDNHKRMRTESPSWDNKPPDFDLCMDHMQQWVGKARMAYVANQQTAMNQQQLLFNELAAKEHLIQQLRSNTEELQKRRQAELARYDNELHAMSSVINGYRRALKSTQQAFAEYRKRSSLPVEPLYKDAGDGGVVKSVMDLEKERLKREEEERIARIMFTETMEKLGETWTRTFEGHLERVEMYQTRVSDIEKDVKLLKETMAKRKASETDD